VSKNEKKFQATIYRQKQKPWQVTKARDEPWRTTKQLSSITNHALSSLTFQKECQLRINLRTKMASECKISPALLSEVELQREINQRERRTVQKKNKKYIFSIYDFSM